METITPTEPARSSAHEQAAFVRARRRVAAIKGFYIHLFVFVTLLVGLFAINAAAGDGWWVHWVLFGWGIGVVAHALAVFGRTPRAIADWERRKLKQLMNER